MMDGERDSDSDGDTLADKVCVCETLTLPVVVGDADKVGLSLNVVDGLPEALGEAVADGESVTDGVEEALNDGLKDTVGETDALVEEDVDKEFENVSERDAVIDVLEVPVVVGLTDTVGDALTDGENEADADGDND